ncbi:MAG: acetylxylan esterase, partial [Planctomycetota bacterium]
YTLPELPAGDAARWTAARADLLRQFADHVFGRTPAKVGKLRCRVVGTKDDALGGLATRLSWHLDAPELPHWPGAEVLVWLPRGKTGPAPCFVGLNFRGNQTVSDESDVPITARWVDEGEHVVDFRATAASRGTDQASWPLRWLLEHGFAVATAYYGDFEPDHELGWRDGLRGALARADRDTASGEHAWGAIGVWASGLSRIADHLLAEPRLDPKHLFAVGHSRLGKAALWAGAQDERFALVIANESGKGGASLLRRDFGETIGDLTTNFPHWFCRQFASYAKAVERCPVDSHQLLALVAPRLLYVASAHNDLWADPRGEFLAAMHASAAWTALGKQGLGVTEWPPVDKPVGDCVGYHVRAGEHGIRLYDWQQFAAFAQRHAADRQ